jgi:hypothetical protein
VSSHFVFWHRQEPRPLWLCSDNFEQNSRRLHLNRSLLQRWIGRTGKEDDALMRWPLRSPDLTPCNFFFLGVCEGHCLCDSTPRWSLKSSQPYHHCRGSGRPSYADTRVERGRLSHRYPPKVDTLSIFGKKKQKKKNLESFSLYRHKNYNDPLRSLFVANF